MTWFEITKVKYRDKPLKEMQAEHDKKLDKRKLYINKIKKRIVRRPKNRNELQKIYDIIDCVIVDGPKIDGGHIKTKLQYMGLKLQDDGNPITFTDTKGSSPKSPYKGGNYLRDAIRNLQKHGVEVDIYELKEE